MPYARPTLSALRQQAQQDVLNAGIAGVTKVLRFSVLMVLAVVNAGMVWLLYGFLDWIALQAVPATATGEFLALWGALKSVYLKTATAASGTVSFTVTGSVTIPADTAVVVNGIEGLTTTASVLNGTTATCSMSLSTPGSAGNVAAGTLAVLSTPIAGVQSSGTVAATFTGGADVETEDAFRSRVLLAYAANGSEGREDEYISWAKAVSGVTRAWVNRNGFGAGSVVVYFMLDVANSQYGGFPQGTDGAASGDVSRYSTATGDQLRVAEAIWANQPVTALVIPVSPIAQAVNFTISDLGTGNTATNQTLITTALTDMFTRLSAPGGTIHPNSWEEAISAIGLESFEVSSPVDPIVGANAGSLPILGAITFVT